MSRTPQESTANCGLRSKDWRLSYRTSSTVDGRPVDILNDFYIPVLRFAVRYDRVAGYFRSTSLAAASQGFSAFVGRQGQMRLIAGADLDPTDVRAILAGDSQHLAARLNRELEKPEEWPQDVRNGVSYWPGWWPMGTWRSGSDFESTAGLGNPCLSERWMTVTFMKNG